MLIMTEIVLGIKEGKVAGAVLKNGLLYEFVQDHEIEVRTGDIFRGVVTAIDKKLNAAFVKIARDTTVYLEEYNGKQGVPVLVQVKREAYDNKDALVGEKLSISGRYAVVLSDKRINGHAINISSKIVDKDRRAALKNTVSLCNSEFSFIIRTAAERADDNEVKAEIISLNQRMNDIIKEGCMNEKTELLYREEKFIDRFFKDKADLNVDKILIQGTEMYEEVEQYFSKSNKEMIGKMHLFTGEFDLFDVHGVTTALKVAMGRKIYLKNGAHIVIDKTEAMTVIDVNSGKYERKSDFDTMKMEINLKSAEEIARLLQLRDIGGIIVIDFLKMREEADKKRLVDSFKEWLKEDKKRPEVAGMTKLGLVELTRKR